MTAMPLMAAEMPRRSIFAPILTMRAAHGARLPLTRIRRSPAIDTVHARRPLTLRIQHELAAFTGL